MSNQDKKLLFNYIAQMDKVVLSKDRLKFPIRYENRRHFHQSNQDHLDISSQYTKALTKIQRRHNLDIADIEGTQSRALPPPRKSKQKILMQNEEDQIDKLIRKQSSNQIIIDVVKTEIPSVRQYSLPTLPVLSRQIKQQQKQTPSRNSPEPTFRIKTQPVEKPGRFLFSPRVHQQPSPSRIKIQNQCKNPTFFSNIFLI